MLLECITDAITTPVTAGAVSEQSRGQSLRVLLLNIVALAVSARNLLLAGANSPSPGVGGAISEVLHPHRAAEPSGGPPSTVAGASVGGLPSGGTSPGVPAASCAPGAEPSGTGGAPAGAPAGAFCWVGTTRGWSTTGSAWRSRARDSRPCHQRKNSNQDSTVTATSSIERFTTAVSRSWQSAAAFINGPHEVDRIGRLTQEKSCPTPPSIATKFTPYEACSDQGDAFQPVATRLIKNQRRSRFFEQNVGEMSPLASQVGLYMLSVSLRIFDQIGGRLSKVNGEDIASATAKVQAAAGELFPGR